MNVFVSWSGGKDCMLALYRVKKEGKHQISCLINMCDADSDKSRSHGLPKLLVYRQAQAMGMRIIQPVTSFQNYESVFKETIAKLKQEGVEGGVFGDIYLMEHRVWIERVCREMEIEPIFPLWDFSTADLLQEFVSEGFTSMLVAINQKFLTEEWLGRKIDESFLKDIKSHPNIDPCAENGEYHSFVYDGPIFENPVDFEIGNRYVEKDSFYLEVK
jgi:uncharacterized protein (TIGR00290 family)